MQTSMIREVQAAHNKTKSLKYVMGIRGKKALLECPSKLRSLGMMNPPSGGKVTYAFHVCRRNRANQATIK